MPIQRARPIDDLYADVSEYDLVLVPDGPFASALNRRLDRPHLGTFAIPPRRLAAGRREQAEDRLAFLEVIRETDLGWKETAHAVGNVLQCWEYQENIEAILEYERYADATTEQVVEIMADLETTSRRLTNYQIDGGQSVAVVGPELFTPLERSILPEAYETFDPFTDEPFDRPPFRIYDSPTEIVDTLEATITSETADEIAIVLDQASEYSTLVESTLEAADIPFYGGPGFIDDPDHRTFLQLLRAGHAGSNLRIADVRPVLTRVGIDIAIDHADKRLHDLEHPAIEWVVEFCQSLNSATFEEALTAYEQRRQCTLETFRAELDRLQIRTETVTESAIDRLTYYLQTYEVPVDRDNEGVLLADAKSAAFVDRSTVFYLGLDADWTHAAPRRPWVGTEEEFERNIGQFQLLIQNGVQQYYLVQDAAGGHPVTPCFYFDELLAEAFERFSDLDSVRQSRTAQATQADGFDRESIDVDPESVTTISQSSLNTFVNCPRDYLFDRIVDSPDQDYFTEGTLFHDFAEFYATHPGAIDDETITEIVDIMLAEVQPYLRDLDQDLRRTRYRVGLDTIVAFLDAHPPDQAVDSLEKTEHDGQPDGDGNYFAARYDRPVDTAITEQWFENHELGLKGLIDLIHAPDHLVDHKSGSKKPAYSVVKRGETDPIADTPNFQAPLYLTHYRSIQPDRELKFTFFHFLEALDEAVTNDVTLEDTRTTVTYYPQTFDSYVTTDAAYETLLDGYKDCRTTFDDLGYEAYHEIMSRLSVPATTDKDELRASAFATQFTEAVTEATSDSVDAPKGCDQAIRELNGVRKRNFFADDLDRFETFVEEQLTALNEYRAGAERFPIEGPAGEPNYRRVDHRDMLLDDD